MTQQKSTEVIAPERPRVAPAATRGAVVMGGNLMALAVVRSLGRRGLPVVVLRDDKSAATASRYATRTLPWPEAGEEEQVGYLLHIAERYRLDGWVLIPAGEDYTVLVARHHGLLSERYRLTTPPWEVAKWACDKRLSYQLAAQTGVDYPWTRYPASREEVQALDCPFPAILKPAYKDKSSVLAQERAWRVDNRADLLARFDQVSQHAPPGVIMVQEMVPGGGEAQFSYAALCSDGHPIASIVARRMRQYPVDFGRASSFVESIAEPTVEEAGRRFLGAMRHTGLVEMEFKHDRRTGQYKLLDVNPRVWGWHSIGPRAGVDFSYLLWRLANGQPVAETRARPGVRWVRLTTDLPAALKLIRTGRLSLGDYLRSYRWPLVEATFAPDDPAPALLDLPSRALALLGR